MCSLVQVTPTCSPWLARLVSHTLGQQKQTHPPPSIQRHAQRVYTQQERDAGKAFDDLLPFLLSRFNAEQEQGRSHILNEVLVNKKFPDDLWEDPPETSCQE